MKKIITKIIILLIVIAWFPIVLEAQTITFHPYDFRVSMAVNVI